MANDHMKNAVLSIVLALSVNSLMNYFMGYEMPISCGDGINDHHWNSTVYSSPALYPPSTLQMTSVFIPIDDNDNNITYLAADVYMSKMINKLNHKVPTIVYFTRFGRAYVVDFPFSYFATFGDSMNPRFFDYIKRFTTHGYAWVAVDIRGTGASSGTKSADFSNAELDDTKAVLDWIVKQSWSNGKVVSYGAGLEGMGALLVAASGHEAVKAVIVNGAVEDVYADAFFPGGLFNKRAVTAFANYMSSSERQVRWKDIPSFKSRLMMHTFGGNVHAVGDDKERLKAAVVEHTSNVNLLDELLCCVECRDDPLNITSSLTFDDMDLHRLALQMSDVPIYAFGGYYDMGTAKSALSLFDKNTNDNRVTLGPWSHAGVDNCDPYANAKQRCFSHVLEMVRFFDYHVFPDRAASTGLADEAPIHYFTLAENQWKSSFTWPPVEMKDHLLHFNTNRTLSTMMTTIVSDSLVVDIDHEVTAFTRISRWSFMDHIFNVRPFYYDNRDGLPSILWTSEIFTTGAELTGTVHLDLYISVNAPDVAFRVYLEDEWYGNPSSNKKKKERQGVTYITEGQIRPIHRVNLNGRSFERKDMKDLPVDGVVTKVHLKLLPISYFISQGHRVRLSIVPVEFDEVELQPSTRRTTQMRIHFGTKYPSVVSLPLKWGEEEESMVLNTKSQDEEAEVIKEEL